MGWTFAYQAGPESGPFIPLLNYCDNVRIPSETDAPKRGSNFDIPYRDGEYSQSTKYRRAGSFLLDCMVSYTNPSNAITHVDGAPGHVYENLQALKTLLGGNDQPLFIRRTVPHMGAVETVCEYMGGIRAAGPRMRYVFPMRMLDAAWREQTLQTDTQASIAAFPFVYNIVTGGDFDIADAKITLTCVANGAAPSIEIPATGDKITVAGSFVATDVIVIDLGRTRAFTLNGSTYTSISSNKAWWMRLPSSTAALGMSLDATSGTWTVKIEWRNKWL